MGNFQFLTLKGARISIGGSGALLAGRAINVNSVTNEVNTDQHNDAASKVYDKQIHQNQTVVGAGIGAVGTLQLTAGATEKAALNISGSSVAANGAVALHASGDINIRGVQELHVSDTASQRESSGIFNTTSTSKADYRAVSKVAGSSVSGDVVTVTSGNDIHVVGAAIAGQTGVNLAAANAVTIEAGTETSTESHHRSVKESGFLSGGGLGITYGTRTTTTDQQQDATVQSGQARSLVGAIDGSLNVSAGGAIKVAGSDLSAGKDINLIGKSVSITPGQDAVNGQFASRMTQDGITLALGGSVVNAIATSEAMGTAAGQTGNGRIKALAAATAAMAGANAARDLAANGPNISISLTVGHAESEQREMTASTVHSGSAVTAGNNVVISATGAGKDSNIDIVGSDVNAKHNISLRADNQVNLLAAHDTESQHSQSKSLSAAVGVAATVSTSGVAYGITGSVSASRGSADGEGTTQVNSHVTAGDTLTIASGGDTNIKGAVASGAQVVADVKGNLNIESLQDTATFDSKQQSISVSATVGVGTSVSASISQSKLHNDYASVQEQSGIRAGDGGFQVKVGGNTDLKGAVISSSAAGAGASSLTTGTLTHSDIANHTTMDASSIGLAGGITSAGNGAATGPGGVKLLNTGQPGAGVSLPGVVATSGSETGASRSGIGAGALVITDDAAQRRTTGEGAAQAVAGVNRNVATGSDTSGRVGNHFDPNAVQASLAVTAAFTASAAPLAAYLVGDAGKARQDAATHEVQAYGILATAAAERGDTAAANTYASQAKDAQNVADAWADNGASRIALHAAAQGLIGALAGGNAGALSNVSGVVGGNPGQQLGKTLGEAQADKLDLPKDSPARASLVNTYQQTLAGVGGALAGLAATGATAQNGMAALATMAQGVNTATTVDVFNRQLHKSEAEKLAVLKQGKSADAQRRLDAAACALVRCAEGVPTSDPLYAKLQAMQVDGQSYKAEQMALKTTGEFVYQPYLDTARDAITSNAEILHRTGGAINLGAGTMGTVGGGIIAGVGLASCPETLGAGCALGALGAYIAVESNTQAQQGNKALWGQYNSGEGPRVLNSLSTLTYPGEADPLKAAGVDALKLGAIALAGKVIPKALAASEELLTVPRDGARIAESPRVRTAEIVDGDKVAKNNFYRDGTELPQALATSAGTIQATSGRTTTVLGRWNPDMRSVIEEQTQIPKTNDFDGKPGGFNILGGFKYQAQHWVN